MASRSLRALRLVADRAPSAVDSVGEEAALAALLRRQHGFITRSQATVIGMSPARIKQRVRSGIWLAVHPGVYCLAGTRSTSITRGVAALLWAGVGACLSHGTAATHLGMSSRSRSDELHVTVPHESVVARRPGVVVHRTRVWPARHELTSGILVTEPTRTLVDLAATMTSNELRATLHRCVFDGIVAMGDLRAAVAAPSRVPGVAQLRRELDRFDRESDSGAEAEAGELFTRAGIVLTRQHEVVADGVLIARLDFAQVDLQLAIEIDGAAYHADPAAQARDRRRDRRLMTLGWQVVRIAVTDLRSRPAAILAQIRSVIADRARTRRVG